MRSNEPKGLVDAKVDLLVIDTAHGHSQGVLNAVAKVRKAFPNTQLLAGNVGTVGGARALVDAGVDGVKVGVGPGSICTTRVVTGVGLPQLTAIMDAVEGAGGAPVVADGGVRYSGDLVKALAGGAGSVMLGSMLAGTDESPGESFLLEGRRFKTVRGMGSLSAMQEALRTATSRIPPKASWFPRVSRRGCPTRVRCRTPSSSSSAGYAAGWATAALRR